MTLPDTSFVCKNIDVEAGTRHWVEVIEGDDWEDMPPGRRRGLMQVAEAIIAAALGEVIPAEVEGWCQRGDGHHDGPTPDDPTWGECGTKWTHTRMVGPWQPVVSDKE
jgi:hypothetical protein